MKVSKKVREEGWMGKESKKKKIRMEVREGRKKEGRGREKNTQA